MNQDEEMRIVDFADSMNKLYDEKETLFKEKMELLKLLGNIDLETRGAIESAAMLGGPPSAPTYLHALRQIKKVIDEFDEQRNKDREVWESHTVLREREG